jgi:nucleoside-diphosphate-sugar epimerase
MPIIVSSLFTGVGFVGRHLAALLIEGDLTSHVRVVDKAPPATGWLNDHHKVRERGKEERKEGRRI